MVERSRRSAGATIGACRAAATEGVAVNLAGGTHHAQRDRGAGYCVFNDAAIAARVLQADAAPTRRQARVAIVDLDVHQGDGTAQILAGDASIFTLSVHGAHNFPFRKQLSDLDVALPDGTADAAYLEALDTALEQLQQRFEPQFIIYLAGADAHEDDRLGKLALSLDGMAVRDRRVLDLAERTERADCGRHGRRLRARHRDDRGDPPADRARGVRCVVAPPARRAAQGPERACLMRTPAVRLRAGSR